VLTSFLTQKTIRCIMPVPGLATMAKTIEDLILVDDRRGMLAVRKCLPADFCRQAARFLAGRLSRTIIITGFNVAGRCETDGPPAAILLGRAIARLGGWVAYVTDEPCTSLLRACLPEEVPVVDFPITTEGRSARFARHLLAGMQPTLLVSIERCAPGRDGRYRNMYGQDITSVTARIDCLCDGTATLAVADGGNEIGMGSVPVARLRRIGIAHPSRVRAQHLVIGATSNWATYGLIAELSVLTRQRLLPSWAETERLLRRMVVLGAVDGFSARPENKVDGFPLAANRRLHRTLLHYVDQHLRKGARA
jgi:hypothetical protein